VPTAEPLLLLSPPPAKRRLSSNAGEASIHGPEPGGLTIKELVEYCRIKGQRGLIKEYRIIKDEPPNGTFDISKSKLNITKNRYTDVLCLDETRVILRTAGGDPSSDYIHANFVDGYRQKNAYISTQGPLPKTFADFWRMVWEQEVLVIVMTTRTVERGRVKCGQYWPEDEEVIEHYGSTFAVENTGVDEHDHYCITSLILQNLETLESRTITHMQFTGWPDYGVPLSANKFLDFMFLVREKQNERVLERDPQQSAYSSSVAGRGPPIVIHCSAGIGRTGTFISMDINTRRLADIGRVDVAATVRRVRSQRAFSIQMPDQYVFCHVALIEHAVREGLLPPVEPGSPGYLDGFDDDTSSGSD
jgi:tyrosine-protein phosphatase non-receptor type 9